MAEGDDVYTWLETGSDHRHSGLYCRHSRNNVENMSLEISTIMNRLGYSEEIRRWRVEKYKEWDRLMNARSSVPTHMKQITVGSKGEGLTGLMESDRDVLYVLKDVLCVEAGINLDAIPDGIDVFRMDTRVYPGHCRLLQERSVNNHHFDICSALCDNGNGDVLLSSSLWLDFYLKFKFNTHPLFDEPVGPSLPMRSYFFDTDRVRSLPCHYPSILRRWAARPRHWPSSDIVHKVVSLGAYVTPVGYKGSDYKHMEWRVCFNTGEAELVSHLTDTQAKVYVILKMILKDIMKPTNKQITSYVMKNIILWQAENTQPTEFHARSLIYWLHNALRELRTAIAKKKLSYYMIPDRNLMAACGLDDALQRKWVADITDMMDEGPRVILRLEKIRKAIVASPEPMLWFSQKRMEFEMLMLEQLNRGVHHFSIDGSRDIGSYFILQALIFTRLIEIYSEVMQRIYQEVSPDIDIGWMADVYRRLLM